MNTNMIDNTTRIEAMKKLIEDYEDKVLKYRVLEDRIKESTVNTYKSVYKQIPFNYISYTLVP